VTDPPKEHPIVMCSESVIATYAGRKTMTRRVMRLPEYDMPPDGFMLIDAAPDMEPGWYAWRFDSGSGKVPFGPPIKCPYGKPGDLLWVRETWGIHSDHELRYKQGKGTCPALVGYKAPVGRIGVCSCPHVVIRHWRSPRFMPKAFARLWLRLAEVRPERLQEISEGDAKAEGVILYYNEPHRTDRRRPKYSEGFHSQWDEINAKRGYPWESNPPVWVLSYDIDTERTIRPIRSTRKVKT